VRVKSYGLSLPFVLLAVVAWPGAAAAQYGPPPGYVYLPADASSSAIRLEVTPVSTEVYVDGFRAGYVDDFDGFFQRLHLRPGEHELVLYLDGYRPVHQRVTLRNGSDQKVKYTMVPLSPGEQAEPRPQPPMLGPDNPQEEPPPPPPAPRGPMPARTLPPRPLPEGPAASPDSRFGTVVIRVQPADAEVLIDGEHWAGPSGQERLVVQLAAGRHRVEVRKDGYDSYSGDVEIHRGESLPLNVSLTKRGE